MFSFILKIIFGGDYAPKKDPNTLGKEGYKKLLAEYFATKTGGDVIGATCVMTTLKKEAVRKLLLKEGYFNPTNSGPDLYRKSRVENDIIIGVTDIKLSAEPGRDTWMFIHVY